MQGDRMKSPMYSSFAIAWLITNWRVRYITIFTSEEYLFKQNIANKLDYIERFYQFWSVLEWLCTLWKLVIIPVILVWRYIDVLSRIEIKIYNRYLETSNKKKKIEMAKRKRFD